jgi:hypothetical protein
MDVVRIPKQAFHYTHRRKKKLTIQGRYGKLRPEQDDFLFSEVRMIMA